MSEHPKTEILRAVANRWHLPREVAEMLWIAAAEIDRLRAALEFHTANVVTGGGSSARSQRAEPTRDEHGGDR